MKVNRWQWFADTIQHRGRKANMQVKFYCRCCVMPLLMSMCYIPVIPLSTHTVPFVLLSASLPGKLGAKMTMRMIIKLIDCGDGAAHYSKILILNVKFWEIPYIQCYTNGHRVRSVEKCDLSVTVRLVKFPATHSCIPCGEKESHPPFLWLWVWKMAIHWNLKTVTWRPKADWKLKGQG